MKYFISFLIIAIGASTAMAQATKPAHPSIRTGIFHDEHNASLPTVFLIGDSTVKNSWDLGDGQLWGWGHPISSYFDLSRMNVENQALGGTSSRSYYLYNWLGNPEPRRAGRPGSTTPAAMRAPVDMTPHPVRDLIKPGDYVIMQFGHNDGPATIKGNGDETRPSQPPGQPDVHTFGWYIRQYIAETKAAGATPIVCSLIPRQHWEDDGKMTRDTGGYATAAKEAAEQGGAYYIDLNGLIADKYDKMGKDAVFNVFGPKETVHTNWDGAVLNAQCVVAGIQSLKDCKLKDYLLANPTAPVKPSWAP